jgi:hypothetical protein
MIKPELTYSHIGHLIGMFLLAIYCILALCMSYDHRSEWMGLTFWPTLLTCSLLLALFSYESYREILWLVENQEDDEHVHE